MLGQRRRRRPTLTAYTDAHPCAGERDYEAESRRGTGAPSLQAAATTDNAVEHISRGLLGVCVVEKMR
jgi:hypothetical protein